MKNIAVTPIISPKIAWESFIGNSFQALGRSVTAELDRRRIRPESPSAFQVALAELKPGEANYRHLSYGFLIAAPRGVIFEFLENTGLSITSTRTVDKSLILVVASGNLEQWRWAIVNCSTPAASEGLRFLMNAIMLFFEKEGFADLWLQFRKSSQPDKTFALTVK
jgi:hypothetical protein